MGPFLVVTLQPFRTDLPDLPTLGAGNEQGISTGDDLSAVATARAEGISYDELSLATFDSSF